MSPVETNDISLESLIRIKRQSLEDAITRNLERMNQIENYIEKQEDEEGFSSLDEEDRELLLIESDLLNSVNKVLFKQKARLASFAAFLATPNP